MPVNAKDLQYCVTNPIQQADGSWIFDVVIFEAAQVRGGVAEVRGLGHIRVDDYVCCASMGEVLRQVSEKLPGRVMIPRGVG